MTKYTYQNLYDCVKEDLCGSNDNTSLMYMNYSMHIRMSFEKYSTYEGNGIKISFHPDNINFPPMFLIDFFTYNEGVILVQYNTSPIVYNDEVKFGQSYYSFITDINAPIGSGINSVFYTPEMECIILQYIHHHG